MTTRMTPQRLARLIADGDTDAVREAVSAAPRLLGRTVEHSGQGGWTPLHLAVAAGKAEIVRVLVKEGADLTAATEDGRTPLHVALECAPKLVPVLRKLGAPLDPGSAAFLDDVETLAGHLDDGAPMTDLATGTDLLSWAALGGAVSTARLLLDRGARAGGGALFAAAERGHVELVRLLLAAGADVDRRDPDSGCTALHAAVAGSADGAAPEIVRLLLDAGADVDATTTDGASALDITRVAAARGKRGDRGTTDAVIELLVSRGAAD